MKKIKRKVYRGDLIVEKGDKTNYNDITDDGYLKFLLFNLRGLGEWIGKKLSKVAVQILSYSFIECYNVVCRVVMWWCSVV